MFKDLHNNVKNILKKDPSVHSYIEALLLYPSIYALIIYRFSSFLYRFKLYFLARLFSQLGRLLTGIEIHPGAKIGKNLFMDHGASIVIGQTSIIGDNCLIYHGVTLGSTDKEIPKNKRRHPKLGNNVVIGAGAKVLGDIEIHDNAKIGANAVVLKDVPKNSTAVGIPARNLLKRSEESEVKVYR